MIFNMGSGGAIGTKVIAVESEQDLPTAAKEGTIAILSQTAIGNVYVAASEPVGAKTGDVWLEQGAGAAEYIIGNVVVNVSAAMLYDGSTWSKTDAWQYKDGSWQPFTPAQLWLFKTGDDCAEVTGGWMDSGEKITIGSNENITWEKISGDVYVRTALKVAISDYSKLVVIAHRSYVGDFGVGFSSVEIADEWDAYLTIAGGYETMSDFKTLELDISSLGRDYEGYVIFYHKAVVNATTESVATVKEVYLI